MSKSVCTPFGKIGPRSAVLRLSDHSDQPLASANTRKSSYQAFQLPGRCPGRAKYSGSDNGWNIFHCALDRPRRHLLYIALYTNLN